MMWFGRAREKTEGQRYNWTGNSASRFIGRKRPPAAAEKRSRESGENEPQKTKVTGQKSQNSELQKKEKKKTHKILYRAEGKLQIQVIILRAFVYVISLVV